MTQLPVATTPQPEPKVNEQRQSFTNKMTSRRHRYVQPTTVPDELIIDHIILSAGNLTKVAEELDLSYIALLTHVERRVDLRNAVLAHRHSLVDLAEEKLRGQLESGSLRAITFTLSTLGKDRGYIPKTEQTVNVNKTETPTLDVSKLSTDELSSLVNLLKTAERDEMPTIEGEVTDVTDQSSQVETTVVSPESATHDEDKESHENRG